MRSASTGKPNWFPVSAPILGIFRLGPAEVPKQVQRAKCGLKPTELVILQADLGI